MPVESPFADVHRQMGADFNEYDGYVLPRAFGDIETEKTALNNGTAAFDLTSFARIMVKPLDGTLTEIINFGQDSAPAKNFWKWCGPLRVAATSSGYLVMCPHGQGREVISRLEDDPGVQYTDLSQKTAMIGIYGPEAVDTINRIIPFDISDIPPGGVKVLSLFMISVTLIRGSWAGVDGMEIMGPVSAVKLASSAVAKYHKRENIQPAGMRCLLDAMSENSRTQSADSGIFNSGS